MKSGFLVLGMAPLGVKGCSPSVRLAAKDVPPGDVPGRPMGALWSERALGGLPSHNRSLRVP
jgi:hypothetical protein